MKKILFTILLGVSAVAMASVVPNETIQIRKPTVRQMDSSKRQIIRTVKAPDDTMSADTIEKLKRYNNVLTKENVTAMENMSRMLQDQPEILMEQMGGEGLQVRASDDVPLYQRTDSKASPVERFANFQPPMLTGGAKDVTVSKKVIADTQKKALKQIEYVGRTQLKRGVAPVMQQMTPEDLEASGVDTSQLPVGWEQKLKDAQKKSKKVQVQLPEKSGKTLQERKAQKANKQLSK